MLEDASIWALVHGWFTPAVFFVLLNVVIGTIAVTSTRSHQTTTSADGDPTTLTGKISRLPFPVLDRIKSFSLSSYRSTKPQIQQQETLKIQPPPPIAAASASAVEFRHPPPVEESHIHRTRSETRPAAGEILKKLPKKMKKSASAKSAFAHFEFGEAEEENTTEEVQDRRPATARAAPSVVEEEEEESGEVDARADDFINKFRNQLKLQRMDSFVRYKEMIKRGGN